MANSRSVSIRTSQASTAGLGEAVRKVVTGLDPAVPLLSLRSIEEQIDNDILNERLLTTLSGFLGALALLLAAVGLYGVVSFSVTRRTREIGIRMALGAERPSVVWLVARYAAALVVAGAAIGVPTALALSKLLKSFLFGIAPQDPAAIIGAVMTLAAAAALACYLPAMRATKVDPMVALRHD
jgi:ABC-type antimicrobial peptide transport system permease subunit